MKQLSREIFWKKTRITINPENTHIFFKTKTLICEYGQSYKLLEIPINPETLQRLKDKYLNFYYNLYLMDFDNKNNGVD